MSNILKYKDLTKLNVEENIKGRNSKGMSIIYESKKE